LTLQVKKIRLSELENFVNSKEFQNYEVIPISSIRAQSYLANPHGHPDDIVLYLGFIANKLVAFRSIFADTIHSDGQQLRFGWCSGAWVHNLFRRKGYSKQLLQEAYTDWNGKLMFTNYSPEAEKLIINSKRFQAIHQFEGCRAYAFVKTEKLLNEKNYSLPGLYPTLNFIIRVGIRFNRIFFRPSPPQSVAFEMLSQPDKDCYDFLKQQPGNSFSQKDQAFFNWLFQYPWLSDKKTPDAVRYPFSVFSEAFSYQTIKVYDNKSFKGFFIFSLREGHLKTLFFYVPDLYLHEIALFLKNYCLKYEIERLTVYKKQLADELLKRKFPFLHAKRYGQKIYSTFQVSNQKQLIFQDGEGDVPFT
jgi:hypothetical protein